MLRESKTMKRISLLVGILGLVILFGTLEKVAAQIRDPFAMKPKKVVAPPKPATTTTTTNPLTSKDPVKPMKPEPRAPVILAFPVMNQRLAYYKQVRAQLLAQGLPVPPPTTVLTLDEMEVTGIFRTPTGYAAMVEVPSIKLSFTVRPGDKFYNGQLVAIEDNFLVVKRVAKLSNGKYVVSAENKAIKPPEWQTEFGGATTAPMAPQSTSLQDPQSAENMPVSAEPKAMVSDPTVSLVDSMNRDQAKQSAMDSKDKKPGKGGKVDGKAKVTNVKEKLKSSVKDQKKPAGKEVSKNNTKAN